MTSNKQPLELLQEIQPKNISDIVQSKNPSIANICKATDGESTAKAMLVVLVSRLVKFFNVGKTMNAEQVAATVELILEAYPMYKIDDFVLCFKRAKLGFYGTVYDRMDGNVIFDWFDKYIEERNAEFENIRLKEKKAIEADITPVDPANVPDKDKPIPMPDYIKEAFKKKINPIPAPRILNQTEEQKEINQWMYEFDTLWEKQGSQSGKRIVFIEVELKESDRNKLIDGIEKDYKRHQESNPTMADSIRARALKRVGFRSMDISEYLQYRFDLKNSQLKSA